MSVPKDRRCLCTEMSTKCCFQGCGAKRNACSFYDSYNSGKKINSDGKRMPTFLDNLTFFLIIKCTICTGAIYVEFCRTAERYPRIQSGRPYSRQLGIGYRFIDKIRLGDQSDAPDMLKNNKAKTITTCCLCCWVL